jgi:hypothetical protein
VEDSGGCCYEEISLQFPSLAPLIPWHLCSTDGPMHYAENVVYLAGDRDCHGLRAGESRQIRNGRTGELCWKLEARNTPGVQISTTPTGEEYRNRDTVPLFILANTADGAKPDAAPALEWVPWLRYGEGKARELDAARRSAIWPEATDEELMQESEELKAALAARLPALRDQFKAAMIECGFEWPNVIETA